METMTVGQLKEKLAEITNDDTPVVLVDSYGVCFPVKEVDYGQMEPMEYALTEAIGSLQKEVTVDSVGFVNGGEVVYIGCCNGYNK